MTTRVPPATIRHCRVGSGRHQVAGAQIFLLPRLKAVTVALRPVRAQRARGLIWRVGAPAIRSKYRFHTSKKISGAVLTAGHEVHS